MAATSGQWESRPLGVLLVVEIQGRLPEAPGRIRESWEKQLERAVKYMTGLLSSTSQGVQQHHGTGVEPEIDGEGVPLDIEREFTAFLSRVDFHRISIEDAGSGILHDNENGRGEYTLFIENAPPIDNDSFATDEANVRGLSLEVQELVRERRVTRIRAYRVVEFI